MAILSVNAGSSSLKFAVHPVQGEQVQPHVLVGNVEGLEPGGQATLGWVWQGQSQRRTLALGHQDPFDDALLALRALLAGVQGLPAIAAVAHRIVHGGQHYTRSVRATPEILQHLQQLNALAPLHQPHNLAGVRAFAKAFAQAPQVLCFDTAFHAGMGPLATAFALPEAVTGLGVRRYGFHGLSYQFILQQLQVHSARANARVLMAHLGNGASVCAAQGGASVATSMGFSALDGLMMGTRSGSLDAGVLLYLLEQGWDHARLQNLLYRQSGLLGVSGISADMRRLHADDSARARFAVDLFAYRLVRECGAMVACLQGLDLLAFSGGIGEHDAVLRAQAAQQLAWLGVDLDAQKNQAACGDAVCAIHSAHSRVEVWVVPTDEGFVAAREAHALLASSTAND